MSIYRSRPPRDKNEGVALAAIVAKESSHGSWSGSGGGVGVGTGGIGVFSASMSGESSSQTRRAAQFSAPEAAGQESFYANSPIMIVAFVIGFIVLLIFMATAYKEGATDRLVLGGIMGVLVMIVFIGFLITLGSETRAETERNASNEADDARRAQVYNRLRYVEKDHIVFDPESGFETAAQRTHILALIDTVLSHPSQVDADSAAA